MDPKACIIRWYGAFQDGEVDEMEYAAEDYNNWISRGGFPATAVVDGIYFRVYGLSANFNEGAPKSPVNCGTQNGYADKDTFLGPEAIAALFGG